MLTVSQLAKKLNISRTTALYYEKAGLLLPKFRSDNGYRWYGEQEVERLKAIVAYRSYGLPLTKITTLLNQQDESQSQILKGHFNELEVEIQRLRVQQKAIMLLLQEPNLLEDNMVNKERWVAIMRAAGFSDNDMTKWHQKFEELEPLEHQKFLESLGIDSDEIALIRAL